MKYLLSLVLLLLSFGAVAESGLYFDADRDGEGILVLRNEERLVAYFFTYGAECIGIPHPPTVSPPKPYIFECDKQGQRWFFFVADWKPKDERISGKLYLAQGTNYPDGFQDKQDPFAVRIGEAIQVGVYTLREYGDGYQMYIERWGDVLAEDDPIFDEVFWFTTLLFKAE